MTDQTNSAGITREMLQEALGLKGFLGRITSGAVYRILGMKQYNRLYSKRQRPNGPAFSAGVLEDLGVSYEIPEHQLDYIPAQGGFFTVSNHHFGSLDGMILNAAIASRRPDYKILTTYFLTLITNLRDSFIPVDNFSSGGARSIAGIRQALSHLQNGGGLGLFPAGEVATWQKKKNRTSLGGRRVVEDKPWADNMMNLIKKSGLPVIPVYFDGENSKLFHILGRIHPVFRTLRLVREMLNKKGTHIKVRIGQPIPADQIASFDVKSLGAYLRNRCYALEAQCVDSRPMMVSASSQEPLAEPVDPSVIRSQMAAVSDKVIFQTGDYRAYLIKASDAPDVLRELYRLREVTFREIGEGSGQSIDTDRFDDLYHHLILWSVSNEEIVGSYRFGYGSELFDSAGEPSGFYTGSLLEFGPDAPGILSKSMELGRAFVAERYQKEVLPLKMLLAGLCVGTTLRPGVDRCIGLVSFSAALPEFYKSLVVRFLAKNFMLDDAQRFTKAPHPFQYDFLRVNPDALLDSFGSDIDAFDRMLGSISDGQFRIPVLARKYFSCGAKATCFNIDSTFSNCLDAMIVLRLSDFPQASIKSFVRSLPQEMQDRVLTHFYGDSLK